MSAHPYMVEGFDRLFDSISGKRQQKAEQQAQDFLSQANSIEDLQARLGQLRQMRQQSSQGKGFLGRLADTFNPGAASGEVTQAEKQASQGLLNALFSDVVNRAEAQRRDAEFTAKRKHELDLWSMRNQAQAELEKTRQTGMAGREMIRQTGQTVRAAGKELGNMFKPGRSQPSSTEERLLQLLSPEDRQKALRQRFKLDGQQPPDNTGPRGVTPTRMSQTAEKHKQDLDDAIYQIENAADGWIWNSSQSTVDKQIQDKLNATASAWNIQLPTDKPVKEQAEYLKQQLDRISVSGQVPTGGSDKVKVSNGQQTLLIDAADLQDAENDGYKRVN